ncbi:MAG: EAL domain-containing protein [Alcanivoracaceae bacterium]|nr:EAL domain-containing protein [Alcanivoracaceae bacterium]
MAIRNHIITLKKGEQVFEAGDEADCAYIVELGIVGLYSKHFKDSRIASLGRGELLGEMGVINNEARTVSAFAETDIELLVIDKEQITKRLQNSDPIIRGVMDLLLRRIRNLLNNDAYKGLVMDDENIVVTEGVHKIRFEKELFQAFDDNEIINVYQPIVNLKDGSIAGFEALSRWQHPEKGMVSPFEFITLAEESDFIIPMGLKIFDSACKQLTVFQQIRNKSNPLLPALFMSINVSAAQLKAKSFLDEIKKITKKYHIDPNDIKIEITESQVVDYKKVLTWIDECNAFGFKLSLDDFGTGYSGFLHLLELDFHTIKIDQAFIKSIDTKPKSMVILEVIADMAKRLDMTVIAEGIEDKNSADKLTQIGVDYGQGYYFFKPMKVEKLLTILR